MVRVLIVDDHDLVAEGLASLLATEGDIDVVGRARTVEEAVALAVEDRPDVVLIDYRLPDGDGVEAGRRIRDSVPQVALVMITASVDPAAVTGALDVGFNGFVLKTTTSNELVTALRAGARGDAHFSPEVLTTLVRNQRSTPVGRDELTTREREIVGLMAEGRSTSDMAATLVLSPHTVRNHVRNILAKLGAHSKLEAVVIASRLGLVDVGRQP